MRPPDKLARLLVNSALFVDSICRPGEWKREADMTDAERERGAAWRACMCVSMVSSSSCKRIDRQPNGCHSAQPAAR